MPEVFLCVASHAQSSSADLPFQCRAGVLRDVCRCDWRVGRVHAAHSRAPGSVVWRYPCPRQGRHNCPLSCVKDLLKLHSKRLPMLYVTVSTVLCLIGYQDPWIIIQFGWLVSWVYLRFYKKTSSESSTDTYGDRSETFAFVYWLPPFLQSVVRPLQAGQD